MPGKEPYKKPQVRRANFWQTELRDARERVDRESAERRKKVLRAGLKDDELKVLLWTDVAKAKLCDVFGIANLSHIEEVRLRDIVRSQLALDPEETINVEENAIYLWLYELYGIHTDQIPAAKFIVFDVSGNVKRRFTYTRYSDANAKIKEIAQNHGLPGMRVLFSIEFTSYLQRLREKAHHDMLD